MTTCIHRLYSGIRQLFVAAALASPALAAQAAGVVEQGTWRVHHTVLPTTVLEPSIARQYGIQRAGNRAFVNISVHDGTQSGVAAVPAMVSGQFVNLLGQPEPLTFREVRSGGGIYYIAEFRFPHREDLRFEFRAQPTDHDDVININFRHSLYEEGRP